MIQRFVLILIVATIGISHDYCSESICYGGVHIACNNTGSFSSECPSNAVVVEFTDKLKQLTLNLHNKYRNEIACGNVTGYGKAARMATLVWNDELAKFAEYNVRQCQFAHDNCRNTASFLYAGQNLGQIKRTSKFLPAETVIDTVLRGWFEEHKDAGQSYIEKFRHHDTGKMIGHFTQVVRDEAYAVGCALVQYKNGKWFTVLFACDYTLSNIEDYPIYEVSVKAASKCAFGVNKKFPNLCSEKELYTDDLFYNSIKKP